MKAIANGRGDENDGIFYNTNFIKNGEVFELAKPEDFDPTRMKKLSKKDPRFSEIKNDVEDDVEVPTNIPPLVQPFVPDPTKPAGQTHETHGEASDTEDMFDDESDETDELPGEHKSVLATDFARDPQSLSKDELVEYGKTLGLELNDRDKKADLIAEIQTALNEDI